MDLMHGGGERYLCCNDEASSASTYLVRPRTTVQSQSTKQSTDLSVLRKVSRIPITHVIATLFVSPRLIIDSRPQNRLKLQPIVVQLCSDDPMILMRPAKFGDVMWR